MNENRDDERYDDILKKIAEARPFGSKRRELLPQTPHDRALDRINAFDTLAPLARAEYRGALCYGPKSLRGSAWSAAVVWYHHKGYHGYQSLVLLGVWAHYDHDQILLSIAERQTALPRARLRRQCLSRGDPEQLPTVLRRCRRPARR